MRTIKAGKLLLISFLLVVVFIGCTTSKEEYFIDYKERVDDPDAGVEAYKATKQDVKKTNAHATNGLHLENNETKMHKLNSYDYRFTPIDSILKRFDTLNLESAATESRKQISNLIIIKIDSF